MTNEPGIIYPTITLQGETVELRFSFLAEFKLDEMGLTMSMVSGILRGPQNAGKVGVMMKLLSACAAQFFIERGETPLSPEQWAMKVKTADEIRTIGNAVTKALLLAKPPTETIGLQEAEAKLGSELKQ